MNIKEANDILLPFLMVEDYRTIDNDELRDVQKAIKYLIKNNEDQNKIIESLVSNQKSICETNKIILDKLIGGEL